MENIGNYELPSEPEEIKPNEESDFLVKPIKSERCYLLEMEKKEIANSLDEFSQKDQDIMSKYINGQEMAISEKSQILNIKNKWWKKKGCYDEIDRENYLYKKYSQEGKGKTLKMQNDLIQAFHTNNSAQIAKLRQEYETTFTDQIEGVEALLNLNDFLDESEKINKLKEKYRRNNRTKEDREEFMRLVPEVTAYQSLLADFIKNNANNKEFLESFWEVCAQIAAAKNFSEGFGKLQAGVLGQVAIVHTMEKLGYQPHTAHPNEDAFEKTDLKLGPEEDRIQIKCTPNEMRVIGINDVVTLPGSKIEGSDGIKFITTSLAHQFSDFKVGMERLKEKLKRKEEEKLRKENKNVDPKEIDEKIKLKAYMIAIPHREFDPVTGIPSQRFIDFVEQNFGRNPETKEIPSTETAA